MTMDWEAESSAPVLKVTLRCVARNVPAFTWLQVIQEAQQEGLWGDKERDALAATLMSCLRESPSVSSLALQYLSAATTSGSRHEPPCSNTSVCKALLDDSRHLQFPEDTLKTLCSILTSSPASSQQDFRVLYSARRCTQAVHLLLLGARYQDEDIRALAGGLLANFSSTKEGDLAQERQDSNEEAECHAVVSDAISSTDLLNSERNLLNELLPRLEGSAMKSGGNRMTEEADSKSLVASVTSTRQKEQSGWVSGPTSPAVPKALDPEIANLLHCLIDEYGTFQCKVDVAKALFNARLGRREASDKDYELFYLDLFHGAASICATLAAAPDGSYAKVWRSALCGLLPSLVEAVAADLEKREIVSTRRCMASVVGTLLSESSHIMTGCEVVLADADHKSKKMASEGQEVDEADMMLDVFIGTDDGPARHPVRAALLRAMEDKCILRREDWRGVAGAEGILADWQDLSPSFLGELGDDADYSSSSVTPTLASYFEQRLQSDTLEESDFLERLIEDHASQQAFSQAILKTIAESINSSDLETPARVCRLMMSNLVALEIVLLYICPSQLLQPIAGLLEDGDLLQNGEDPAVIGTIVLFAQVIIQKGLNANFNLESLLPNDQTLFLAAFARSSTAVQIYSRLSITEKSVVSSWITALFGSEGIPDELIKSSSPQLMLRISPILFSQSVTACYQGGIDSDTLRGGLTYFLQDLLNYTLPSSIDWLLSDMARCHHEGIRTDIQEADAKASWTRHNSIRMEILSMLLLSENCPRIVQSLVSDKAIEVIGQRGDLSSEMSNLLESMKNQAVPSKAAKTHLWIKIVQPSMTPCTVDSLLGLDVSIGTTAAKRGVRKALQITMDNLLVNAKSEILPRAVAMSLFLAHTTMKRTRSLADDILVLFTNAAMMPRYRAKAVILTLSLLLEMLSYSPALQGPHFEMIQAIIALHVRRLLKTTNNPADRERLLQSYRILLQNLDSCTILFRCFSDVI